MFFLLSFSTKDTSLSFNKDKDAPPALYLAVLPTR